MTAHDNEFRIYFNKEEINAMRTDMVVGLLYLEIRCHMDNGTRISGLHKKFSEQYFLDCINTAKEKKDAPCSRFSLRRKLLKMEKMGLILQKQKNSYVFECPLAPNSISPYKTREKKSSAHASAQVIHRGKITQPHKIEDYKSLILKEKTREISVQPHKLSTGEKSLSRTCIRTSHIISNCYNLTNLTSLAPPPPATTKEKAFTTHCPSRASASAGPRVFLNNSIGQQVLDHLNARTGKRFVYTGVTKAKIERVLQEGASLEDCKRVIDQQCEEWGKRQGMQQYLRPKTLFNSENFWNYQGQLPGKAPELKVATVLDLTCCYQHPSESAASRERCEGKARRDGTEHLLEARFGCIVCPWHQIVLLAQGGDIPSRVLMENLLAQEGEEDIRGNLASLVRCSFRSS